MNKIFLTITLCILASCNTDKKTERSEDSKITIQSHPKESNLEQLKTEASRLRGGGSIKTVEFKNGIAIITYVKNYAEYKQLNPQSNLSEDDLKGYWSSGDAIQKALVDGSVRLMKNLDFINEVQITLPFQNKVYAIDVKKTELEKFIGRDFPQIRNNWTKNFIDPYVYDKKGRKEFFNKFSKSQ
ncbi:hypothetical protein [Chryseobacterium rhizosphaerae]|uniref:hypothetical protein n=1 Tax=Chryseobacterium rhizosphaerae TaxID=395937 RepID=UPI003D0FE9C1